MDNEKKNQDTRVFEEWEEEMVKKRARSMIGKFGFTQGDLEDIEQDLYLSAYLKKPTTAYEHLDEVSRFKRFVDNKASRIIRSAQRNKRKVHMKSVSLSKPLERGEGERPLSFEDVLQEDQVRSMIGRISKSKEDELRDEFVEAYKYLSDRQKQVFLMRADEIPVIEIANRFGINRDTVYEELKKMRVIFEKRGLL